MKSSRDTGDKETLPMKKTKKTKAIYDDGDDAHFDGNPAVKGRSRKGSKRHSIGGGAEVGASTRRSGNKKTTRKKRVAGK